MIDVTQFILIVVVVSLTVVLLVIGIQAISILKEFRRTLFKLNKVLDETGVITESVAKPISAASGFLVGINGASIFSTVIKLLKKRHSEEKSPSTNRSET